MKIQSGNLKEKIFNWVLKICEYTQFHTTASDIKKKALMVNFARKASLLNMNFQLPQGKFAEF